MNEAGLRADLARLDVLVRQLQGALGGRLIRGYCSGATGAIIEGEGFTVSDAAAIHTVTFATPFADVPVVVIGVGNTTGAFGAKIANGTAPTVGGFQCVTFNTTTGAGAAAAWTFLAIGPI